MRLDKFLKVSRIIKRRTVAKEICDRGRVRVNGRNAKAGQDITAGDVLHLEFGKRILEVEVLATAQTVRASQANELYRILSQEEKDEPELL